MKIRIAIWQHQQSYSVHADEKTGNIIIGYNTLSTGATDFISTAIKIVSTWPENLQGDPVQDGTKYKIAYNDGKTERQLVGVNATPPTFNKLMALIEYYKTKSTKSPTEQAIEEEIKELEKLGIHTKM